LLVGVAGVMARRNVLITLFSIQLILVAASINFAAFGRLFDDAGGQVFAIFLTATIALETCAALAIFTVVFRRQLSPGAQPSRETWN
jgi:NADH-quinone oxidoreductase subunit K